MADKKENIMPLNEPDRPGTVTVPNVTPEEPALAPVTVIPENLLDEGDGERFNPAVAQSGDMRRYCTALAQAQGMIRNATKSSKNDHFKTSYADLAEVADACRAALSAVQISWEQIPRFTEQEIWLETILTHGPSGQYRVGRWPIHKSAANKSQDLMAAFTYGRRGSLAMMVGVVSEDDDDGNSTQEHGDPLNQDQGERTSKPTKAQAAAEQWAAGAIRKIGTFKTMEDLNKWEDERQDALADLYRILPEKHKEVMAALQEAGDKLAIDGG